MKFEPLHNPAELPLDRHLLIEAGAGTGKTYTLENLVVRLLRERPELGLENILVVTFTEKAASELKMRVRSKLSQALAGVPEGDPARIRLSRALDLFDNAAIFTIHGFCQTLLTDMAYENRVLFEHELVDDGPLLQELVQETLRGHWPARFGDELAEVLAFSAFGDNPRRFGELVGQLARSLGPADGRDRIHPDSRGRDYAEIRAQVVRAVAQLKAYLAPAGSMAGEFQRLHIHASARSSIIARIITPLDDLLHAAMPPAQGLPALRDLLAAIDSATSQQRKGLACLEPDKWTKKGPNPEAAPRLGGLVARLRALRELILELTHWLTQATLDQVRAGMAAVKRQKGWLSYDDMLTRVARALSVAESGRAALDLAHQIRQRYKVAFVDEFQDTDPVQWRIFKTLFLPSGDDPPPEGLRDPDPRLVLIGDPKQAIYAFRGADIFTYLEARREMEALARRGQGALYNLSDNWRSLPELVAAFNQLFGASTHWFEDVLGPGLPPVGYPDAGSPGAGQLPRQLMADGSGRAALNLVDLSEQGAAARAKGAWSRWVAREIRYLLTRGGLIVKDSEGDAARPLNPGDIALLVRSKSEVPLLEEALDRREIPYTYYKKPGLFESLEATHLAVVLEAVADPGDESRVRAALLTFFFGIRRPNLHRYYDLPAHHAIKQLLFRWHHWARAKRWSRLFPSLLEESGLIHREARDPHWDRRETNLRQIVEHLATAAALNNLDFRGLRALLAGYRQNVPAQGDEGDLHQIDTQEPKVQIMTMHAAKGLQFPVVFLAGGLTGYGGRDGVTVYHAVNPDSGAVTRIFDLDPQGNPDQSQKEAELEERRLLYVALTRAQFKLYLPFFPAASRAAWWGPCARLLAPALKQAFAGNAAKSVAWLERQWTAPLRKGAELADSRIGAAVALPRPLPPLPYSSDFTSRRIRLSSFSSLHARQDPAAVGEGQGLRVESGFTRENDEDHELLPWADPAALEAQPDADPDLPGGAAVGSLVHDLLEILDFRHVCRLTRGQVARAGELAGDARIAEMLAAQMALHQLTDLPPGGVARLITAALVRPLDCVGPGFRLGDLDAADCLKEVEFLYPVSGSGTPGDLPAGTLAPHSGGMLRGYIDLIFRRAGRYFIVDYKTNYLPQGYDPSRIAESMDRCDYHLQYKIYTVALLRRLQLSFGDAFNPREQFGGVLYLYLRGMAPGPGQGIYFVPGERLLPRWELERELTSRAGLEFAD